MDSDLDTLGSAHRLDGLVPYAAWISRARHPGRQLHQGGTSSVQPRLLTELSRAVRHSADVPAGTIYHGRGAYCMALEART